MRRPQVEQIKRALHSGQIFQVSLTSIPQLGHDRRPSGVSHTGHRFQVSLTGSPHAGQVDPVFMLTAHLRDQDFLPRLKLS
jgi:hypothetical protein